MPDMRELILSVLISRPIDSVFEYLIDPAHSPEWIDSFMEESAQPWPPRVGTIYRNLDQVGEWREYTVEAFKPPRHFGLASVATNYHVEYLLSSLGPLSTKLAYHEWVEDGELDDPFTIEPLDKLRKILES
jgi:hypothetical protein